MASNCGPSWGVEELFGLRQAFIACALFATSRALGAGWKESAIIPGVHAILFGLLYGK